MLGDVLVLSQGVFNEGKKESCLELYLLILSSLHVLFLNFCRTM